MCRIQAKMQNSTENQSAGIKNVFPSNSTAKNFWRHLEKYLSAFDASVSVNLISNGKYAGVTREYLSGMLLL